MGRLITTALLMTGFSAGADDCGKAYTTDATLQVQTTLVNQIVRKHFPDLCEAKIKVVSFQAYDYGVLDSEPEKTEAFKSAKSREYRIRLSDVLLANPPTDYALRGALTHELVHITDYYGMSSIELITFGLDYWSNQPYLKNYEKFTDCRAVLRNGAREEYIEFRKWQATILDRKGLADSKARYLWDEELATVRSCEAYEITKPKLVERDHGRKN